MATSQYALLGVFRHMGYFAFVLTGRTHIDQRFSCLALSQRLIGKRADFLIEPLFRNRIVRPRVVWHFPSHRALFGFPLISAAIENLYLLMPEQSKGPQSIARPPVRLIAVEDACGIERNPVLAAQFGEFFRR